jgi:hypothetical protein
MVKMQLDSLRGMRERSLSVSTLDVSANSGKKPDRQFIKCAKLIKFLLRNVEELIKRFAEEQLHIELTRS